MKKEEHNPILDVLFICLGVFILLNFLAVYETSGLTEKPLSALDLSSFRSLPTGSGSDSKVTLSVDQKEGKVVVWMDERPVRLEDLEQELKKMDGLGQVALRRAKSITVETEDQIIAGCRRAGILRISFIVKSEEKP